jgi:hypothetical protein
MVKFVCSQYPPSSLEDVWLSSLVRSHADQRVWIPNGKREKLWQSKSRKCPLGLQEEVEKGPRGGKFEEMVETVRVQERWRHSLSGDSR